VRLLIALLLLVPAEAAAGKCHEVSDTVGYTHCSRYGRFWSAEKHPPAYGGFVFVGMQYGVAGRELTLGKREYDGGQLGVPSVSGVGWGLSLGGYFNPWLYLGFEGGAGWGSTTTRTFQSGDLTLSDRGGLDVFTGYMGLVPGVRAPLGRLAFRVEALAGYITLDLKHAEAKAKDFQVILMPRVAVDLWAVPYTRVSVFAGVNPWHLADRQLGLTVTFHHRAFDGQFSL
jgi:hypothetical protein